MRYPRQKTQLHKYICELENTVTGTTFEIAIMAKSDKDLMDCIRNKYFNTELIKNRRIQ